MRTVAIILLAAVNLALLVTVSLRMVRPDDATWLASAPLDRGPEVKIAPSLSAPSLSAPILKTAPILYVKEGSSQTAGSQAASSQTAAPKSFSDSKDYVATEDAKDSVPPVAELVPVRAAIPVGIPNPNLEFLSQPPPGHASGSHSLPSDPPSDPPGLLDPPRVINVVPPTVSQEAPL